MGDLELQSINSDHGKLRVLCISPSFIPYHDSEAICGGKIVRALHDFGVDVTVIAFDYIAPQYRMMEDSSLWNGLQKSILSIPTPQDKMYLGRAIGWFRYRTIVYVRRIIKVLEYAKILHNTRPFDIVYSRSLPMIAHVAAYWVSDHLRIPWIANINDPWDWHLFPGLETDHSPLYRAFSNYWLARTLRNADLVTYPSGRLRDFHIRISNYNHKSAIIPHIGYSTCSNAYSPCFALLHAGKLGPHEPTGRSSRGLLLGLKQFLDENPEACDKMQLRFVGPEDEMTMKLAKALQLSAVIHSTGRVNYEASIRHIAGASVCILVEGKMKEGIYFPSKLTDYIASHKPIIALSPTIGVVGDMLPGNWIQRADPDDSTAISDAITYFYKAYLNGTLNSLLPPDKVVGNYEPQVVAGKLISLMHEACKRRTSR